MNKGPRFGDSFKRKYPTARKRSLIHMSVEDSNIMLISPAQSAQRKKKKRHRMAEFTDYEGALVRVVTNLLNCELT
ncbi:hypothetical protein FC756_19785 [Lysinibacillus mangiferihumi]|uniref:Uncharacterized protein n=1 Tax=Lysinibacillus mangiferihumi TaxID=1130819 RepID=A0A4U2YGD8_9BACI|nr:hypothetical protein [Lysinibacillus mangiferihumi]TKI60066.1 hypothetical protein FC756_19785 [Lysinibacillus mangiferihumi]